MTAPALLLLGLAVALLTASPAPAEPAGDPVLTDAPPPVPLGIIEGSAAPVAPMSPRPRARTSAGRARSWKAETPAEKPMDRWARIPRPQNRSGGGSAFALSNAHGGGGGGGGHGGGASCGY